MNKWLLRTTLGVFLLSQLHTTAVFAQATEKLFSDIDQASNWSLSSIAYLNELGITQGYDNGTYQPRKKITRQEVAELLVRALQIPANDAANVLPPDVRASSWSANSIQRVQSQGLMGNPNEPFRPTDLVTREELLSIFVQATGAQGKGTATLSDSEVSDPVSKPSIETSMEIGLLQGDGQKLALDRPTERQEIAVFLTRLIQALEEPKTREMELTIINESTVRIGAFKYPVTEEIQKLLTSANKKFLEGATLKVTLTPDYKIQNIVDLTVPASKKNLVFDGGDLHITGNLIILGDELTIKNLSVDGQVLTNGNTKTSLVFENAKIKELELNVAAKLTLTGTTSVDSLTVAQKAVKDSEIVLQQTSVINDIIVPDKQLVPNLVKDYSGNQGKIQLINGKPRDVQPTVSTGGSTTGGSSGGSVSPAGPVVSTITKIQEVAEAYQLPAQVSVRMPDGSTVMIAVVWTAPKDVEITNSEVLINEPGIYLFTGQVEGISEKSQLKLDVRLPLKLQVGSENTGIVVTTPGVSKTVSFTSQPVPEVATTVNHASYLLEWNDENGSSSDVELISTPGYTSYDVGNGWLITKSDDAAVVSKETISFEVKFNAPGTYSVQISAVKHKHFD
ncbi:MULTISPECIES: S-layer homology domain-containing protein [Paenibacillus]|uniref:S-layer family protein n=1 Tax=Paenibacillus pabuli TaxID=1472 RepID=A0A855YH20_9BACL|nr:MULTISPECIES: S-layer homology domain-containing protein [Paenibacillus]PWW45070.1 S-layer family protein [Paenibacillus pabuli]PXW11406.1 S-layer family protein [Paenibacillus taichungensis]